MNSTQNAWMKSAASQTVDVMVSKPKVLQGLPRRGNGRPTLLEPLENRCMLSSILGTAAAYGVLGGTTVTNAGATAIVGDLGVSPGTAITGFGPGTVSGTINADNASAVQAQADLVTAYNLIAAEPTTTNLTGQNLSGLTLTPGVYTFNTAAQLTGALSFDAQGNPNAQFVIRTGTTLITGTASAVNLIDGAQADNVFFEVGSSATIGPATAFQGNILANTSITLDGGATILDGRALAHNGAVTMDTNQVSVPEADVSVTGTLVGGVAVAGNNIAYSVTVANAGPNDAQNVVLSDLLPTQTIFVSDVRTSGPTFTLTNPAIGGTGTITGTIGTLATGASATFTIVARVPPGTLDGTSIVDSLAVTSDTIDPNPGNNNQTITTSVIAAPTLTGVSPAEGATVGGTLVTITGTDLENATRVDFGTVGVTSFVSDSNGQIVLLSPAGTAGTVDVTAITPGGTSDTTPLDQFTYGTAPVIASPDGDAFTAGLSGTFLITTTGFPAPTLTISALPAGLTFVDNLNGTATLSGTPGINTAGDYPLTITAGNGISPDATQSFALAVQNPQADVSVAGTLVGGVAVAGNNIAYSVTVANAGPNDAQNVVLSDLLPSQTTFVSDVQTSGPAFTLTNPAVGGTGTITGTIGLLASGASATFTIVARVPAGTLDGTSLVDSLAVTSDTVDPNPGNNGQIITTSVVAAPIITGVSPAEGATVGGTLVTITGTDLENATRVDFGSVGVTSFISDSSGQIVLLSPAGTAGTVDVTAITPGGTSDITPLDQFTYGTAPTITSPDDDVFTAGLSGTFLITTTGFPAPTLTISALPAGLTFVDNLNGTATLSGTPGINTAGDYPLTITASNGISPDATQSFALAVQNPQADVSVAGTLVGGTAIAGNNIAYSVTVANAGPNDAPNVVLSDLLPTQTIFVSDVQTSGPAFTLTNPAVGGTGTITGTIGTLASGASATFTIIAHVPPGTPDGTSIVDSLAVTSDTIDPNPGNNNQTITTSVIAAPTLTGVSPAEGTGDGGTLVTITGTNLENATAVDFGTVGVTSFISDSSGQIVLLSPAGTAGTVDVNVITPGGTSGITPLDQFTYGTAPVITSPDGDAFTAGLSGTFLITTTGFPAPTLTSSTLPAGLTFVDNLNGTATLSGTPGINAASDYPLTITAGNGISPDATQSFTLAVQNLHADISVLGTLVGGVAVAGNNIAYFVIVTNNGPNDAPNVVLSDLLPTQTTFVSNEQTSGPAFTLTNPAVGGTGTITGTIGLLASGASATFTIVARVPAGTPDGTSIVDSLAVTSDTIDPNLANNAQTITTSVIAAPTVTGVSPAEGAAVGGTIVTITGTNLQSATAVDFGTVSVTSFVSDSNGQIVLLSPAGTARTVDVTAITSGGTSAISAPDEFTYSTTPVIAAPTITGVGPTEGATVGGTTVTIAGTNLENATAVDFGSVAVTSFVSDSNGQIVLLSPAGTAGTVNVTAITPGGTSAISASDQFTYGTAPVIPVTPTLTTLTLIAPANNVNPNRTLQFTAAGTNASGLSVVLGPITWSLGIGSTGSIDQNGLYTAGNVGGAGETAIVRATSGGQTASQSITVNAVAAGAETTQVSSFKPFGNAQSITGFVVTLNGPVDPTTAQNVGGYQIVGQYTFNKHRNFLERLFGGNSGTQTVYAGYKIASAVYDSQANSVTLTLGTSIPLGDGMLWVEVTGTGSDAVLDANGKPIDGDANGTAGGNYRQSFGMTVTRSISYPTASGELVNLSLSGPGEIVTLFPGDTDTPLIDLIDTNSQSSILTGSIDKGHNSVASAVLGELDGTANASIQLGDEFQIDQNNAVGTL